MRQKKKGLSWLGTALAAAAVLALAAPQAGADEYPDDRIRFVIPFGPGGGSDAIGLRVQRVAPRYTDKSVQILHMPGGAGVIGTKHVAEASPEQPLPLLVALNQSVAAPPEEAGYTAEDFEWIAQIMVMPIGIIVPPGSELDFIKVVEQGRQNPGAISAGVLLGGGAEVISEMLEDAVGEASYRRVPYSSVGEIVLNVSGGHLDMGIISLGPAVDANREGTARLIAHSHAERLPQLPDVPTMSEVANADLEFGLDRAIFVQKGISPEAKAFLVDLFEKVVADPDFVAETEAGGEVPIFRKGEDLEAHLSGRLEVLRPFYQRIADN
jgi:tripartite-type tricarboxylate transporter receptor subunit TctC